MGYQGTETTFEETLLERLQGQGYGYLHAKYLERRLSDVVLRDRLRAYLSESYPHLPELAVRR